MTLPGDWLHGIAVRYLDPVTVDRFIAPAVADLQYEVATAGPDGWNRWVVRCRGDAAVLCLVVHCLLWRMPVRGLIAVFLLGSIGGALAIIMASSTSIGPAPLLAFLVMAVATVAVLRFMRLGQNYRQAFLNCGGVGLIMGLTLAGWFVFVGNPSNRPWFLYARSLSFLAACVGLGSALVAAVAWKPAAEAEPIFRLRCIQVLSGCAVFGLAYSLIGFLSASPARLLLVLSWTAFLACFFAAVSLTLYLPVLLTVRRFIHHRLLIAMMGAVLFPIPMMGLPFLQGRLTSHVSVWFRSPPQTFLLAALPYALGGAVLGWLLSRRQPEQAPVKS